MYYKLTDQNMRTYGGFQWELNKWEKTDGKGGLCSSGWIHLYNDPILAVLLNPIHANISNPRLFEVRVKGKRKTDHGLKFGFTNVKLIKELSVPKIMTEQKVRFGILCAMEVHKDKDFIEWAENWLNNKDKTKAATRAAARAAEATKAATRAAAWAAAQTAEATWAAARAAEAAWAAWAAWATWAATRAAARAAEAAWAAWAAWAATRAAARAAEATKAAAWAAAWAAEAAAVAVAKDINFIKIARFSCK